MHIIGSRSSSSKNFLEAVKPRITLISVGIDNKFEHPHNEVLKRLEDMQIKILRTDVSGEIKLKILKNGNIEIKKKIN